MITSFIEILQLPSFGHMSTSTIQFGSCDKILLLTSWTEIVTTYSFFQNNFVLRRPGVANFVDIKIALIFLTTQCINVS